MEKKVTREDPDPALKSQKMVMKPKTNNRNTLGQYYSLS